MAKRPSPDLDGLLSDLTPEKVSALVALAENFGAGGGGEGEAGEGDGVVHFYEEYDSDGEGGIDESSCRAVFPAGYGGLKGADAEARGERKEEVGEVGAEAGSKSGKLKKRVSFAEPVEEVRDLGGGKESEVERGDSEAESAGGEEGEWESIPGSMLEWVEGATRAGSGVLSEERLAYMEEMLAIEEDEMTSGEETDASVGGEEDDGREYGFISGVIGGSAAPARSTNGKHFSSKSDANSLSHANKNINPKTSTSPVSEKCGSAAPPAPIILGRYDASRKPIVVDSAATVVHTAATPVILDRYDEPMNQPVSASAPGNVSAPSNPREISEPSSLSSSVIERGAGRRRKPRRTQSSSKAGVQASVVRLPSVADSAGREKSGDRVNGSFVEPTPSNDDDVPVDSAPVVSAFKRHLQRELI